MNYSIYKLYNTNYWKLKIYLQCTRTGGWCKLTVNQAITKRPASRGTMCTGPLTLKETWSGAGITWQEVVTSVDTILKNTRQWRLGLLYWSTQVIYASRWPLTEWLSKLSVILCPAELWDVCCDDEMSIKIVRIRHANTRGDMVAHQLRGCQCTVYRVDVARLENIGK